LFRFEILTKRVLLGQDGLKDAHRQEYSDRAQQRASDTVTQLKTLEATYMQSRPVINMDELEAERRRFDRNCRRRGDRYVEEYRTLATHLLTEREYLPLPLQEKEDIVKSFGFCKFLAIPLAQISNGSLSFALSPRGRPLQVQKRA
jgi:hypothetical protein